MIKIIFLDIDGVIATPQSLTADCSWGLTDSCQDNLGEILRYTKTKIVLSSSWRLNNVEDTKTYMTNRGFRFSDDIIGVTVRGYHYIVKGSNLPIPRGVEIKHWVDSYLKYPWVGDPSQSKEYHLYKEDGSFWKMGSNQEHVDYNYIILDDESDMLLQQKDNFIQCNPDVGLTYSEAVTAIFKLNLQNK